MRTVWKAKYTVLGKDAAEREWLGYKGVGRGTYINRRFSEGGGR